MSGLCENKVEGGENGIWMSVLRGLVKKKKKSKKKSVAAASNRTIIRSIYVILNFLVNYILKIKR